MKVVSLSLAILLPSASAGEPLKVFGWKEQPGAREKVGSDHPYHHLGSAVWHLRMGRAFAGAMLEMTGG